MAWAASTQCAGGQGWTAAGKEEEEEELEDKEDKEEEKEVGHCSTGKLSVSPAPRPKAPKVLPPTISCPLPILLPMHPSPFQNVDKIHEAEDFFNFRRFTKLDSYKIGKLQSGGRAKCVQQLVCLHPVCILGQILHFCSSR